MSPAAPPVNRFFLDPRYSIFYRRARKASWSNEIGAAHALLIPLSGLVHFKTGELSGTVEPGQVLLVEPSEILSASGKDVETLYLTLAPQFLLDYAARMRLVGPSVSVSFPVRVAGADQRINELATTLKAELSVEHAGREIILTAVVEQIVVHILRHFSNLRRSDELELSRVGLIDRRIRRAVELMHSQLDRELSLKEIAEASYLSPFHFARLFKKLTGTSPHAYLAALRTTRAQMLLAESDLSVTAISARVGYASSSHFTKAFRNATGLTPSAFRKAIVSR